MRKVLSAILVIIFGFTCQVSAVDIQDIRVFTDRDGLPHNTVSSIFQDDRGFMWMKSVNTLSRYDGNEFRVILHAAVGIPQATPDKKGNIWGRTASGRIKYYNPKKEALVDFMSGEGSEVFDIITVAANGDVWLWGTEGCCRISPDDMRVWVPEDKRLSEGAVLSFFEDSRERIWLTMREGLFLVDGDKTIRVADSGEYYRSFEFERNIYFVTDKGIAIFDEHARTVSSVFTFKEEGFSLGSSRLTDNGVILISGKDDIYAFDIKTGSFKAYGPVSASNPIPNARFIVDNRDGIWVYNMSGVLWRYKSGQAFETLELMPSSVLSLISSERYDICHDSRDIIWISTFGNGLFALDPDTGRLNHFTTADGLPTNYLNCVTEDRSGEIWVGTDYSGAVKISLSNYPVEVFYPAGAGSNDRSNAVRLIYQDSGGRYWFGTRDGELFICDSQFHTLYKHRIGNGMPYTVDEDALGRKWVGTKTGQGVMIFSPDGQQLLRTVGLFDGGRRIAPIDIFSIMRDRDGRMWVSSLGHGLFLAQQHNGGDIRFLRFPMQTALQNRMRGMTQTSDGLIWTGSDQGVIIFDPEAVANGSGTFINLSNDVNDNNSLSHNEVKTVFEDSQRRIWLGTTDGGLNLLVRETPLENSTFRHYDSKNGLNNNTVQAIEEDGEGFLWVSTESGMSKFDPRTGLFDNFFFSEDQNANIFNERSSWEKSNGELMFGSYNGIYIFNPSEIAYSRYAPAVMITNMQINGNDAVPSADDSPLSESITYAKNIRLKHNQNSFNFEFAMLNYTSPELNQFTYFLESYEKDWNPISRNNVAAYRNVPPGTYLFRLKGSNGFGVWSDMETILKIKVLPPWWTSWWAVMLYAALLCLAAWVSWRIIRRINRLNTDIEVEKQLTEHKLRFFTNISHEFRTPLTIMRGSVENLAEEKDLSGTARKQVNALSKSSHRLLRLVDQLLEFRSLQNSIPALDLEETEIVGFFRGIYDEFSYMAEKKNIGFSFDSSLSDFNTWVDRDKMEKIAYNLLSNALKNTPAGGKIVMKLDFPDDGGFALSVSDSGKGIPSDKREMLFKRFARISESSEGTGIGLHLVSELAAAHNASIEYADSELGGACFVLNVPLTESLVAALLKDSPDMTEKAEELPILLKPMKEYKIAIIEDDEEIRIFINDLLSENFTVVSAENGDKGLKLVMTEQPDLVVCDVMMPGMNGFEITKRLKDNFETSHVPIILLTAHTSEEHQLAGIRTGADAYIAKPFSVKYLLVRIFKLIEQREKLQQKFTREPGLVASLPGSTDKETAFFETLHIIMERNIDNASFTVDNLMKEMGMSRTTFYQKVKGVTGSAPNEYLRIIRLKKAAELLKTSGYNISEISYRVGFEDPLYFSKCFKAQFGKSPSQYRDS